jgi:hypothetical protein
VYVRVCVCLFALVLGAGISGASVNGAHIGFSLNIANRKDGHMALCTTT